MILIVDFNMREADGRIPALLPAAPASRALVPGETVIATDGEGIECRAVISEISSDGRYAMLETIGGTRRAFYLPPLSKRLVCRSVVRKPLNELSSLLSPRRKA